MIGQVSARLSKVRPHAVVDKNLVFSGVYIQRIDLKVSSRGGEKLTHHESLKLPFTSSCRDHRFGIVKLEESVADGCNFELSNLETVEASALFLFIPLSPLGPTASEAVTADFLLFTRCNIASGN